MKSIIYFFVGCLLLFAKAEAQLLQSGFDKDEYIELLKVSSRLGDSTYFKNIPAPAHFHFIYRSPVVGLRNRWDLWVNDDHVAAISIRGTTSDQVSWLANFYAAMVPAKGQMVLADKDTFHYQLASNPRAAVHVGWLVSTGFLVKDILPKIDSLYKSGTKNILIAGHSQGGAIAFMLTAYLYNLQKQNVLPADIRFKTYCSAAPKPGNLYFAYEYEALTQNGWAFNVINSADWVPQTPVSIQSMGDFNEVNPFTHIKSVIKKQKWPKRWALYYVYGRLDKPVRKAVKNYRKYLGKFVGKSIKKELKGFVPPAYCATNDYARTGNTIVLLADEDYYKLYPQDEHKIFVNHYHQPYLYLAGKLPSNKEISTASALNGEWELNYISGRKIAFGGLYPGKKPVINFDITRNKISGNTSCNSFSGVLHADGNAISFSEPFAMTKMFCPGEGEQAFLDALKKIDHYVIENNTLSLIMGDVVMMRFYKKFM